MSKCKYCDKEHPQIGMTIIPSCVDVKIKDLQAAKQQAEQVSINYATGIRILAHEKQDYFEKWQAAEQKVRALGGYAVHKEGCRMATPWVGPPLNCTCGLAQLQSATADKEGDGKG